MRDLPRGNRAVLSGHGRWIYQGEDILLLSELFKG